MSLSSCVCLKDSLNIDIDLQARGISLGVHLEALITQLFTELQAGAAAMVLLNNFDEISGRDTVRVQNLGLLKHVEEVAN